MLTLADQPPGRGPLDFLNMPSTMDCSVIELDQAELQYTPGFVTATHADILFQRLQHELEWRQSHIYLFGRRVAEPRLTAWYADAGVVYRYSGRQLASNDWPDCLTELRALVCDAARIPFNSMLGNLYRNGRDYMGWHSDDEASLGQAPVIASVSLGVVRPFVLRRKEDHQRRYSLDLAHGSLLVMQGATQHAWQHSLPRRLKINQPRINLTFRHVVM